MKKMKFQWKLETRFGHVDVKGQFYIQLFQLSQKSSGLGSVALPDSAIQNAVYEFAFIEARFG